LSYRRINLFGFCSESATIFGGELQAQDFIGSYKTDKKYYTDVSKRRFLK